jgi:hypothetical protein
VSGRKNEALTPDLARNVDPSSRVPSVCFIDGDSQQTESDAERIFRLPGQLPEAYVYDAVLEKAAVFGGVLAVRLHQPHAASHGVIEKLRAIRLTNHDPHVLFSQVGQALGLIPESTVRDAFLTTWAEAYPDEAAVALGKIADLLPRIAAA